MYYSKLIYEMSFNVKTDKNNLNTFYLFASSLSSNVMILHEANFHIPREVSLSKSMLGLQLCISLSIFHLSLSDFFQLYFTISCNFLHSNPPWRLNKWLCEKEDANAFVSSSRHTEQNIHIFMLVYTNKIKLNLICQK